MVNYLIEIRFLGKAKKEIKQLIYEVSNKFNVKGVTSKKVVPHITLFGPFQTKKEKDMLSKVVSVVKNYDFISFKTTNFGYFNNVQNKVIYLEVIPSKELEKLRWDLSRKLAPLAEEVSLIDKSRKFYFHTTIAYKDIDLKFKKIWNYLKNKTLPKYNQKLIKIIILKDWEIFCEYDLVKKKLLNRKKLKNKKTFLKTANKFKIIESKRNSFWSYFKSLFDF